MQALCGCFDDVPHCPAFAWYIPRLADLRPSQLGSSSSGKFLFSAVQSSLDYCPRPHDRFQNALRPYWPCFAFPYYPLLSPLSGFGVADRTFACAQKAHLDHVGHHSFRSSQGGCGTLARGTLGSPGRWHSSSMQEPGGGSYHEVSPGSIRLPTFSPLLVSLTSSTLQLPVACEQS